MESSAIKATYAGGHTAAGATMYFGFTLNELGVIVGIATSVAMFAVNVYFQWKRDQREERASREPQG